MPYIRPTLTELRQQALQDVAASLPTGVPLPNTPLHVLSTTQAGFSHEHYGYLDWIAQQSNPFTSTGENLEGWARLKGVLRNPATPAKGAASFTGNLGTQIPAGTSVTRADGTAYMVDADVSVGSSLSAVVALTAIEPGIGGNADSGITLTLSSPISGLKSIGVATKPFVGGVDLESDNSYRTRMNQKYAAPPQGGAVSDYVTWALEVPGISRAWAKPNGAGPGTVVVYVMLDAAQAANGGFPQGTGGTATGETRDASATGDLLNVANHIHPLRPATALVYSVAPQAQPINITLANLVPNNAQVSAGIQLALKDLYTRVGTPLGGTIYPSDINAAIESVSGISHFTLLGPITPVTTAVGSLPTTGTLTAG